MRWAVTKTKRPQHAKSQKEGLATEVQKQKYKQENGLNTWNFKILNILFAELEKLQTLTILDLYWQFTY